MPKIALIFLFIMMSLVSASAFADSLPGQDINTQAIMTCQQLTQLNTGTNVTYLDSAGNPTQESEDTAATVYVETSLPSATTGTATTFIEPDADAPVYFTLVRSLYMGASLAGKCVKIAGKIHWIDSICYLDDGSAQMTKNPSTGRIIRDSLRVPVRTDLLTSIPSDGDFVTIQGVCRKESDNQISLLPMLDSAVRHIQ